MFYSPHFSLQVELDQPPGGTLPVSFLYSMCDIRSATEKHPLALGNKFYLLQPGSTQSIYTCTSLLLPAPPSLPLSLDSQPGQNKFWASLIWSSLFSKAQGNEKTTAPCVLNTSTLLSYLTNLAMKRVWCCRSNHYWLLLNRALIQHQQGTSCSHASENGFVQTKVANLQKPSKVSVDVTVISP